LKLTDKGIISGKMPRFPLSACKEEIDPTPRRISGCKRGQVAQSVEQRTENPCVGGSIPPLATIPTLFRPKYLLTALQKLDFFYKIIPERQVTPGL
jgi:hypothetical protein